jgi:hypothetical protein
MRRKKGISMKGLYNTDKKNTYEHSEFQENIIFISAAHGFSNE